MCLFYDFYWFRMINCHPFRSENPNAVINVKTVLPQHLNQIKPANEQTIVTICVDLK